jgi:endonuclease YncB( thermonuclease family)
LFFILLLSAYPQAAFFTGKLVKVLDGDTVEVMHDSKAGRIRLAQIDCTEKAYPYGQAARRYVLDVAAQKMVTAEVETVNRSIGLWPPPVNNSLTVIGL